MSWEELYLMMKDTLDVFGLRWKDRDKVQVDFDKDEITFIYKHMTMTYKVGATRWGEGYE